MNKPKNDNDSIEEQIADFTDQILKGNAEEGREPRSTDPELRALQQSALRLKNALPKDGPDEEVIQRMRKNIVMQWSQQEKRTSMPFWKKFVSPRKHISQKWQSQQSRRQQSQHISIATLVFLLFISIFFFNKVSSVQLAASGQNLNGGVFFAFGGLILLAIWFFYRKR